MKKKLFISFILIISLIFISFFYLLITERNPSEIRSNLINKDIPSFQSKSLFKNEKFISNNEFGKEIILVNFFATWCKPCLEEHVYIKRFAEKEKIRVIGINYKDDSKKTKLWLKKLGNPYSDVVIDKKGNIAIDWGVYGIPETFIVSSNKKIKYRLVGQITEKKYNKLISLIKKTN